jgi:hypothetical protein
MADERLAAREMCPDEITGVRHVRRTAAMSGSTVDRDLASLVAEGREAELPAPNTDVPMVSRSRRLPVDLDVRPSHARPEPGSARRR